jgi:hypothetical protein
MSPQPKAGVMGSLPRTRPHRRSAKRPPATGPAKSRTPNAGTAKAGTAKAGTAKAGTTKAAAARTGTARPSPSKAASPAAPGPPQPRPASSPDNSPGVLETAVQAAAELTEIGLHAGARALRRTLSRLSR